MCGICDGHASSSKILFPLQQAAKSTHFPPEAMISFHVTHSSQGPTHHLNPSNL